MIYPRPNGRPLTSDAKPDGIRSQPGASCLGIPTAWAQLACSLLEFAGRHGISRRRVLAAGRLDDRALENRNARIPLVSYFDMLEEVAAATDEHLGLHLAMEQPHGIEILGFLMTTSATFGDALRALTHFQRLLYDGQPYRITDEAEFVVMSVGRCDRLHPAERHMVELLCYELTAGSLPFFGCAIEDARVELRSPKRAFGRTFLEALGDQVRFGAPEDRILIPRAELGKALSGSNPAMRAYFERQLASALAELPPPTLAEQVRAFIERNLERGPGLHDAAVALGLSARTLQRRLQEQGVTVRALVEDARKACAEEVLLQAGTVARAARRLGYSEPSAFHRAFKRWTGRRPGELLPT